MKLKKLTSEVGFDPQIDLSCYLVSKFLSFH